MNDDGRRLHDDAWPMNYNIGMVNYDIWTMVNCRRRMVDYWWSVHYEMVLFVCFGGSRFFFGVMTCVFTRMVTFLFRVFGYRRFFRMCVVFGCK